MDKNQQPGIYFEKIDLLDCHVSNLNLENDLAFNLSLTDLRRTVDDEDKLFIIAAFDIFKDIEATVLSFQCSFLSVYSHEENSSMKWDDFEDAHLIAHMLPFVREFISNITWRTPLPRLNLPPVNAYKLVEDYENKTGDTET